MSEPGPDSIPTSADPRSRRPVKRRAVSPHSEHATHVESLFRDPSKELRLPGPSRPKVASSMPPPPEIVANVQGSSAGAGSGEFHVYKASRRREYERLRLMQDEVDREKTDAEWQQSREKVKQKDEEKTEKNRKRREKRRAAKKSTAAAEVKPKPTMPDSKGVLEKDPEQVPVAEGPYMNMALEPEQTYEAPGIIIHDD